MSEHNFEVESGKSIKLLTKNKVCTKDIVVSAYGGSGIPDGYIKPEGSMPITENGTFDVREKAEVNVQVSLDIKDFSYFCYSNARLEDVLNIDTSSAKSMIYFFARCSNPLPLIDTSNSEDFTGFLESSTVTEIPLFNTKKGKSFYRFLYGNTKVTESPLFDTSNGTDFSGAFEGCSALTSFPPINTSKATTFLSFIRGCSKITEISELDTANGTNFQYFVQNCTLLETIHGTLDFSKGTNYNQSFTGCTALKNIRFSHIKLRNNQLNFSTCSQLTVDSLLSILNALSDNTELTTAYTLHLGSANLAKLTQEQKEIAYNKNIDLD